jgi:hypothetical protein
MNAENRRKEEKNRILAIQLKKNIIEKQQLRKEN